VKVSGGFEDEVQIYVDQQRLAQQRLPAAPRERCDEVARGILEALERMSIDLPIVVRLDGTNAAEGRAMLAEAAPPNLYVEETMLSAAERVVELAKERR